MKKIINLIGLFIVLFMGFNFVSADVGNCGMMGGAWNGMMGGFGTGMMFFSWITYLLIIGLIIAGIYWLIKSANKKKNDRTNVQHK